MSESSIDPPNLTSCESEPIHIPGSIQPYGVMLVAALDNFRVLHVAGDVEQRLGSAVWEDQPLSALIGDELTDRTAARMKLEISGAFIGQLATQSGDRLDVSAHRSGAFVVVEMEAASDREVSASVLMDGLAASAAGFERASSLAAVCTLAAIEFRRLTGFDRVMVYQFLDDAAGRVLAEDRRPDLHSFLNQHFPASDIPPQARALYLRNLARVIPDVGYRPARLRPNWTGAEPLDLSDSSLRSVSPVHLQYLTNMGVAASASFSIVKDGALWGLIACHNEAPLHLPYDIRAACRSLVGSLARQIKSKEEAENYRQRIRLRTFEGDIVTLLNRDVSVSDGLAERLDEIGEMMDSDGVTVLHGNQLATIGVCPSEIEIRTLVAWLLTRADAAVFSSNQLSSLYPPAARFQQFASGLLAVTLSPDDPWVLMCFRAEQVETVNWAGNPRKSESLSPGGPLTPRASFDAWSETVRGRARNWSLPEFDAATRLKAAVRGVEQNQRVKELNVQLTKILHDKDSLLQQKEFLIGEINHRIQNSLQLVSSFLSMQGRASESVELKTALEEARRRLSAVALVHRRLYRGDQIEVVNAARYIEDLCADTTSFMGADWAQYLSLDLAPVLLSTDKVVTLGLVLTELVINSNKYAYDGFAGPIEIKLTEDRTHLKLTVSDKGVGKDSPRKGFGSRMIDAFVAQLGGAMASVDNQPGLRTEITVPIQ